MMGRKWVETTVIDRLLNVFSRWTGADLRDIGK